MTLSRLGFDRAPFSCRSKISAGSIELLSMLA